MYDIKDKLWLLLPSNNKNLSFILQSKFSLFIDFTHIYRVILYLFYKYYILLYRQMNKRCAFYSSICHSAREETLINQGCIKSCILPKKNPCQSPSAIRVLFDDVYRKE